MKTILVKAFSRDRNQGNPAGVILDADNLVDGDMIKIAADLGFSESVFISKSNKGDFGARFFTSTQEVDMCGHATIAAAYIIKKYNMVKDDRVKLETKAGVVSVEYNKNGLIIMEQKTPEFGEIFTKKEIAPLLNISEDCFADNLIQSVSTGVPKLIIPLKKLDDLFGVIPNLDGIKNFCLERKIKGFYPFTAETKEVGSDFHARQFNPAAGINEDPITGVAAGALGAYAVKYELAGKNIFVVEQGYVMNKAGKIFVEVSNKINVGGYAVEF